MPGTTDATMPRPPSGQIRRAGWLLLGLLCVVLGWVGAFVPLMPTTIFMILAAGCFARSSPRLEAWLFHHPRFGPTLRAWHAERAIPRSAKSAACLGIAIGFGAFWFAVRPTPIVAIAVAVPMLACAAWIASRPTPGRDG